MLDYARSDTHYLLFIYDNMRNELIDKSSTKSADQHPIDAVLRESKGESLQRFEWPFYDTVRGSGPNGWNRLLYRTPALFSKEQFSVFRAIHQWRDTVAREEDESLHYVMPKRVMFSIATSMPTEMPPLLGMSHPISNPMRVRAGELLEIIKKARSAGADGPEMRDLLEPPEAKAEGVGMSEAPSIVAPRTVQADSAGGTEERVPGELPLRNFVSRFWGPSIDRSLSQHSRLAKYAIEGLHFAVPLPQLTAEVFSNSDQGRADATQTLETEPGTPAEHEYQKVRVPKGPNDDGIFVIKQMGGARKRKSSDPLEPTDSATPNGEAASEVPSEIPLGTEEAQNKARRKAERKAQKKLKKEQAQAVHGVSESSAAQQNVAEAAEPFDYANAESILHAKRDFNDRQGPKKAFDPYAKSMDAPKGMRKTKREIAGKSFTFPK